MVDSPRMRVIAGPNGSGKSRIRESLPKPLIGIFVNADEIELKMRSSSGLDFATYNLKVDAGHIKSFVDSHPLSARNSLDFESQVVSFENNVLRCHDSTSPQYFSAILADYVRKNLIENRLSFTFETVMSSADKIETLKAAHNLGFRTYLYYVATQDPTINVGRVEFRVSQGGHDVPEEKVRARYYRSLNYF